MSNILTSDVLVLSVKCYNPHLDRTTESYCYFDEIEQEYFICGGSILSGETKISNVYKFYCTKRKSLLGMLDSVIECSPWHIEVAFLNFPNLFVENDYIDYSVLSDTHNKMLRDGECWSTPGLISQVQYSEYNDDVYYAIKKHIKLLRNVRW